MKTKEELNALKEECTNLSRKLAELSEDELEQIAGGIGGQLMGYRPEKARMDAWDLIFSDETK